MTTPFITANPSVEDCWRGVVLYGRNTASYKFALATALLEIKPQSGQLVKLEDIAPAFAKSIAKHLIESPKQITTKQGKFLDACQAFNLDRDLDALTKVTVAHGFANVIDAFHVVATGDVLHRFFIDERKPNNGLRITDEFSKLIDSVQSCNLEQEVEARWRLVETAWNLGISTNLLSVQHDHELGEIFTFDNSKRRKNVTSSRAALNGYQKGKCFYCFADLSLLGEDMNVEVDHFFPDTLKHMNLGINFNGIWNLVLSCVACNRGPRGKHARIPSIKLLERLHTRNEFFIGSHHPLRETLIQQTGMTTESRGAYLGDVFRRVNLSAGQGWEPQDPMPAAF